MRHLLAVGTGLMIFLFCHAAVSASLVNGDFSQGSGGLLGWNNAGEVDATVVDGEAVLQSESGTGFSAYSSVLVQGDDGFFTFEAPIMLSADTTGLELDFRSSFAGDTGEFGTGVFPDTLTIALYDADDQSLDLFFVSGNDFDYNNTDTMETLLLDASSLAGRAVALSLEIYDENNGQDLTAYVDNIRFVEAGTEVPLPASVYLFGSALLGLLGYRRKCVTDPKMGV